ncbi:MAG: phospho-N-acetylmuramoyl-pentapeptide-transferase [Catalinimonas sp.]
MLYYLFGWLDERFDFIGAGVFQYISFRAVAAAIASLLIAAIYGKQIIGLLRRQQVGETVRDLGLEGQMQKTGTPTMGGIIILSGIVLPALLFARLDNVYILLLIISTVWMGLIGFADDYIKVFKKDKAGLHGKFKVVGQVGLGLIVGLTLYFHDQVVVRQYQTTAITYEDVYFQSREEVPGSEFEDVKSQVTTIPFLKNNELNYRGLAAVVGLEDFTWVFYVLIVIFIVTAVSNGANITDGIDGLAAGTSAIIGFTLGVLAYVSGHTVFSNYLGIMFIPDVGELVIFCAAFVGACVGFLWYNSYPAQVFMGDTGSLAIGGIIAVLALAIRKELLIPILCGVFLVELLSVIIQVSYFKWSKKKYGEGRRVFRMSPLHHHYQKAGFKEPKIVARFWIIGLLLAIVTLSTLKLR